ncbi:hypothetical protein K788_0006054 (plasmid) [Paraburkholderia caribensis MBA4]|uniref:Uncharacterized protein n=1 Tax=Paraburkholderia caribensis MBA4 TaxID=1323664 RepID=A0A0P0RQT7_9BURK|nr:hypothetical protein K788_0006054 [Paraburkholderia caribensis MBA4]
MVSALEKNGYTTTKCRAAELSKSWQQADKPAMFGGLRV